MQKSHERSLGNIFIALGLFCLLLWGYQYFSHPTKANPPSVSSENSLPPKGDGDDANLINPKQTFSMGVVELTVNDLEKEALFYRDTVGFDTISKSGNILNLGANGETLLRLIEEKNFSTAPKSEAGLYHIAITHNSRKTLAQRARNILTKMPERFQGSADHSATEAFYFSDPEGNGLELYYDKPRKDWVWQDGKPLMGTQYLDTKNYIERFADAPVSLGATSMGHVHLKIGNIEEAKKFYVGTLLFEEMNNRGDALFVSRDRYHHHLGMNTWESLGAGKRTKNTYGLKSFEIRYHELSLYETVRHNLSRDGFSWEFSPPGSIEVQDPWGNTVIITLVVEK